MKFEPAVEQYLDWAVQERVKRWQATLLQAVAAGKELPPAVPDALDNEHQVTLRDAKIERIIEDLRRSHKYKATYWVHRALWTYCYAEVIKKESVSSGYWCLQDVLRGDRGTRKARDTVLRELGKRYKVVDKAFHAKVWRFGGQMELIVK